MVHPVQARKNADFVRSRSLDLAFRGPETFTITTEHGDVDVRTIVVGGEEHHRCQRDRESD